MAMKTFDLCKNCDRFLAGDWYVLRHDGQAGGRAREDASAGRVGHKFILGFWTGAVSRRYVGRMRDSVFAFQL